MNYIYSIIAGIIQGVTEFLPVSSSGHLVLFHDFFNFNFPKDISDNLAFDVILHLGTLVSLLVFFWPEILKYLSAWFRSFISWEFKTNLNQRLAWYFFVATLPAAIVGYFLEDRIEILFRNSASVALMLIIFGIILYLADKYSLKLKTIDQVNWKNTFLIGISQVIALIPGISRSGITIITGLTQKLKREDAAHFSFILAIPIVFGAGAKSIIDLFLSRGIESYDLVILLLGFLSSAVTGYICIKYFLQFLKNHSLAFFAYYRIIVGIIILIVLFFR